MDHTIALQTKAPERYVLGEMPDEERDAFEDHYFACELCADDLRALSVFVDHAKALLSAPVEPWPLRAAEPAKPARSGWFGWLRPQIAMAGLAAALVGAVGLDVALISRTGISRTGTSRTATPLATVLIAPAQSETRGGKLAGDADEPVLVEGQPFSLPIALEESVEVGAKLGVEIQTASGSVVRAFSIDAPSRNGLSLTVPDLKLSAGRYAVVINKIKYPFVVQKRS